MIQLRTVKNKFKKFKIILEVNAPLIIIWIRLFIRNNSDNNI